MNRPLAAAAVLLLATAAASRASAQGPAGAGAAVAAGGGSSSHSYNPTKWFGKKDAKPESAQSLEALDSKLEPRLRAAQVLGPNATLRETCVNFVERVDCLAALHASKGLALDFECVRSNMSGVRIGTASSCRIPADDKPLNLTKTIKLLKPDADAKGAAKEAENLAKQEIKEAAGS